MAISAISGSSTNTYSPANADPQVRALKAKIQDWADCPTTNASTKKAIVGRLQVQLSSLTASITAKADSQAAAPVQGSSGSRLDIRA